MKIKHEDSTKSNPNKYVIRISKGENFGYFGRAPYTLSPLCDAIIFNTMKEARHQLNRLNGKLMKEYVSTIEKL